MWSFITESAKPYQNGKGKSPLHPLCKLNEDDQIELEAIFKDSQFKMESLLNNTNRFYYASQMLVHLGLVKNIFMPSCIYPLHTFSNMMKVDLHMDFYVLINRMKKVYAKNGDLFNSIVLNNDLTKCIYLDNFKRKVGFTFDDLLLKKDAALEYTLNNENATLEELLKSTDALLEDAEEEFNSSVISGNNNLEKVKDAENVSKNDRDKHSTQNQANNKKPQLFNSKKSIGELSQENPNGDANIKHFWWFLKYPVPPETFKNKFEEKQICIKCT